MACHDPGADLGVLLEWETCGFEVRRNGLSYISITLNLLTLGGFITLLAP